MTISIGTQYFLLHLSPGDMVFEISQVLEKIVNSQFGRLQLFSVSCLFLQMFLKNQNTKLKHKIHVTKTLAVFVPSIPLFFFTLDKKFFLQCLFISKSISISSSQYFTSVVLFVSKTNLFHLSLHKKQNKLRQLLM